METIEIINLSTITINDIDIKMICRDSNLDNYLEVQIKQTNKEFDYTIENRTLIHKLELYDYLKFVNNFDLKTDKFEKITNIIKTILVFNNFCTVGNLETIANTLNLTLSSHEIQVHYESNPYNIENEGEFKIDKVLLMGIEWKISNNLNKFEGVNTDFEFIKIICHLYMEEFITVLYECENINKEYFNKNYY